MHPSGGHCVVPTRRDIAGRNQRIHESGAGPRAAVGNMTLRAPRRRMPCGKQNRPTILRRSGTRDVLKPRIWIRPCFLAFRVRGWNWFQRSRADPAELEDICSGPRKQLHLSAGVPLPNSASVLLFLPRRCEALCVLPCVLCRCRKSRQNMLARNTACAHFLYGTRKLFTMLCRDRTRSAPTLILRIRGGARFSV